MTKPAVTHSANVQPTAPAATATAPAAREAPQPAGVSRGWRIALFLWATAFVCLLVYELLNTAVRLLGKMF